MDDKQGDGLPGRPISKDEHQPSLTAEQILSTVMSMESADLMKLLSASGGSGGA